MYQLNDRQTYVAYAGSDSAIRAFLSGTDADRADYPTMFARDAGFTVQYERVAGMFAGFGGSG
jgi:hypothetical protein